MTSTMPAAPDTGQHDQPARESLTQRTARAARSWLRSVGGQQGPRPSENATERMFAGIRHRMALWYSAILAVILILAGILVYGAMQQVLLGGVPGQVQREAQEQAGNWLAGYLSQQGGNAPASGVVPTECVVPMQQSPGPWYAACYSANGKLLAANVSNQSDGAVFRQGNLAWTALKSSSGTASDWATGTITYSLNHDGQGGGTGTSQPESDDQTLKIDDTIARYAQVVPGPNGTTLGVVVIGEDISGSAHALSVLRLLLFIVGGLTLMACGIGGVILSRRALAPARLAFARQQTFIADASHELRTPLTLMRANAEVLLSESAALPAEDAQLLHSLVAEVEHMGAVTTQLLELARLDAGEAHSEQEALHLGELATTLAQQTRALAETRGVTLHLAVEGDPVVVGDRVQLTEVGLILVDNAIKYNVPNGSVDLRVTQSGDEARFTVSDTGLGIPAVHLARLGERFYRVDKARSRKMGGAGLGLAIARRIAVRHGGTLTLTSEEGHGTTATLTLPLARGTAMPSGW